MNVFVVVPTIRSLDFLKEWGDQFQNCFLIIVEDHKVKAIPTPQDGFLKVFHYTWGDIKKDFGQDEWIFSRKNAGIRSYGFWKAYTMGADVVITLDDDCFPTGPGFVQQHLDNLATLAPTNWFPTFPHPNYMYTRGFPYNIRNKQKVMISHGLWSNKMDMDAKTQLAIGDVNVLAYPPLRQFVPHGLFFAMSSMNLSFNREIIPLMYFPLMGQDQDGNAWGFDRYDDIWAGVFVKKILDHLGFAVVNGSPFVEHRKASDVQSNLIKEKTGMEINESLWKVINNVALSSLTPKEALVELTQKTLFQKGEYFTKLKQAIGLWAARF